MGLSQAMPNTSEQVTSKFIANMLDWRRLPSTHLLDGRCRVFYERVITDGDKSIDESSASTSAIVLPTLVDSELPF